MEVESLDEPRGCSLGLRPPACQTGPVGPAPPGRARHARAPVLEEDPRGRPHAPSRCPFVPGGSADTRNDVLKVFTQNSTAVSPACYVVGGRSRGRRRRRVSATLAVRVGDPSALGGTRRPCSRGTHVQGSRARRLRFLMTNQGRKNGLSLTSGQGPVRGPGGGSQRAPSRPEAVDGSLSWRPVRS